MDAQYCIQTKASAFIFTKVGESREVRFSTLNEAIKYAESLPQVQGSKLAVLSEKGVSMLTLQL